MPNNAMPASDNEYGFAASSDCLTTVGNTAFLITGGSKSRALRSDDGGLTWTASDNGIPAGESAGGFAGDFADQRHGIAVGGDFADPTDVQDTASYTTDGRTWTGGISLTHVGEDVSFLGGPWTAVATGDYRGSTGTSLTTDGGRTWTRVSDQSYHAVECLPVRRVLGGRQQGRGRPRLTLPPESLQNRAQLSRVAQTLASWGSRESSQIRALASRVMQTFACWAPAKVRRFAHLRRVSCKLWGEPDGVAGLTPARIVAIAALPLLLTQRPAQSCLGPRVFAKP
ncbi:hypothetical protein [Calidifontibacter indicus]|uniref:hypothetical protein n=1 Tax=Calidifontibacter indicus TaxID=419650 RepID=UPI003D71215A